MKKKSIWIVAVLFAGAVYYLFDWAVGLRQHPQPPIAANPLPEPVAAMPATKAGPAPAEAQAVAGPPDPPPPIPVQSDAIVVDALEKLLGRDAVAALLYPDKLTRRIVATIDNLTRETVAARLRPFKAAEGTYAVVESPEGIVASPANPDRYSRHLEILERMDAKALVAVYVRLYPLFQQTYRDLGYPKGQFNNRLLEAIADLLDAPEPSFPPVLVQPKVLYRFADPELESRSAGQKIMMRMGAANEKRVKSVLRAIRTELGQQFAQR